MRKFFILILLFSTLTAIAQQKTITGKVVDEKNAPVAFATVKIKKTNAGVSADAQGSFTINAAPGDVLVVSATGMVSKEATVGTQNNITVTLNTANTELSAVVVTTALGIQRQAKDLGYATTTITNATIIDATTTTNDNDAITTTITSET